MKKWRTTIRVSEKKRSYASWRTDFEKKKIKENEAKKVRREIIKKLQWKFTKKYTMRL